MSMSKTGIRQRKILELMSRHGGVWPWPVHRENRHIFRSLEQRGLVQRVGGSYRLRTT